MHGIEGIESGVGGDYFPQPVASGCRRSFSSVLADALCRAPGRDRRRRTFLAGCSLFQCHRLPLQFLRVLNEAQAVTRFQQTIRHAAGAVRSLTSRPNRAGDGGHYDH